MERALIETNRGKIAEFCQKWRIAELALFGSAVRQDFGPASDVDVLVTFDPDSHPSLFDLVEMEEELKGIFGRDVDLVSRRGIETSRNYLRRSAILNSARVLYAA
jgi:predicted nucleotidyltransferase